MTGPRFARARFGTVGRTLLANLGATGAIMALALFVLFEAAITRSFTELENKEIAAHLARIHDFKRSSLKSIEARSKDWGIWDDTYRYAQDFNAQYAASNINSESFQNAVVDGMVVVQTSTGAIRSSAFDRSNGHAAPLLAQALKALALRSDLSRQLTKQDAVQAFVPLEGKIYALGAVNIRRSDGRGPSPGYLAFIQRVDDEQAAQALQVPTKLTVGGKLARSMIVPMRGRVKISTPLDDITGKPIAALTIEVKRPLPAAANELVVLAFGGAVIIVFAMLAALNWRLRQLVLNPVETLHGHLQSIRASGELKLLEVQVRNDEFGAVQDEFNQMATELQTLRSQVESQSFALGRSQTAAGLMHNLRNCLSPVGVILDMLERDIAPMPSQVSRALGELAAPSTDPSRRAKLAEFVTLSLDRVDERDANNRLAAREAARSLMSAFAAIDAAQQDMSTIRFDERCDISVMLSHASNIARFSGGPAVNVTIRAQTDVIAAGNRVLLSQVIENVIANALEAIQQSGRDDGEITLDADLTSDRLCRIVVTDNGAGFDRRTGQRLFERGFSTRQSKSGGLGLHWCANTVKAMGGSLSLESDGPDMGAKATIDLARWVRCATQDVIAA